MSFSSTFVLSIKIEEWLVEVFGSFPYQNTNHCSETPEGHMSLRTYVLLQKVAGMVCRGIWRLPVSKPQSLQREGHMSLRTYVLLQKVAGMVCRGIWRLPVSKPQSLQRNPRRTYVPKDICPFAKSSWNVL